MTTPETYELFAVKYAHHGERYANLNFIGGDPHDGPMPLDFYVWLARGKTRSFVVDLGFNAETARHRKRQLLRNPADALRLLEIGIEMGGVRGENDPAAPGPHADDLQPHRMAADMVDREPGRQRGIAVMEADAALIDLADETDDVLDGIGLAERAVRHVAPGGVGHLLVLDMEVRLGEEVEIADMVVVEMGQDDVLDDDGVDVEEAQPVGRVAQELALAVTRGLGVEAEIDDEAALGPARQPDVEIERHRPVMRVAADEVEIGIALAMMRVFDGEEFVDVSRGHCGFSLRISR